MGVSRSGPFEERISYISIIRVLTTYNGLARVWLPGGQSPELRHLDLQLYVCFIRPLEQQRALGAGSLEEFSRVKMLGAESAAYRAEIHEFLIKSANRCSAVPACR